MPSHNLSQITLEELEILGYSVAGEESVVARLTKGTRNEWRLLKTSQND
jgi:hypothetical protein